MNGNNIDKKMYFPEPAEDAAIDAMIITKYSKMDERIFKFSLISVLRVLYSSSTKVSFLDNSLNVSS